MLELGLSKMKKKIAFSVALCFACAVAQTEEVTSYDDSFFDEPAAVNEESAPTASNSKSTAKPSDITVLDGLSVEDESEAETSPVDTKTKAESVKVLDTKELQGSSATIAEATNRSSGVKIRQSGGLGGESKINIRGMEGKNVKVLVDGVPVDNGNGSLSINDIPIDKVDRIEVYKSYVPERFATDGMGGVINIVTRNLPESSIAGSYSFGSFNTHKASLDAKYVWVVDSTKQRSVETGLSAYYNYSDNDYRFTTPYMDTTVTREHNQYYSYNIAPFVNLNNFWFDRISVGGSYAKSFMQVQATSHRVEKMTMDGDGLGLSLGVEKSKLFLDGLSAGLSFNLSASEANLVDTSSVYFYGWDKSDTRVSDEPLGERAIGAPSLAKYSKFSINVPWNVAYSFNDNHSLTWSGLYKYDSQKFEDELTLVRTINNTPFDGYDYSIVSGLSLENNFFDSRLQNVLGVKGFYYKLNADNEKDKITRLKNEDVDKKDFGYSENIRWKIIDAVALRAGFQHSLRFPTRDEIFGDGLYVASAPTLKPEKSNNFTAGIDVDLDKLPLILKLHLEWNGFYLLMDDRIYISPFSSTPRPCYNSSGTKTKGFEIEANIDVNEYVNLSWNMTFQDVRSREDDRTYGISKGWIVPNIPRFYTNFGVEFHAGDLFFAEDFFKVYWLANYTDEYYYSWKVSKKQKRIIPSAFTQDVGIEYSIWANKLSWNFELHNLMDVTAYDKFGESKMGRAFFTKLNFNI